MERGLATVLVWDNYDELIDALYAGKQATQEISLTHIMSYPITPVPLSMARIDGSMCMTQKSTFAHRLEELAIPVTEDITIDTVIIDFMFFLRSLVSQLPTKYCDIAKKLINVAKQSYRASVVVFACDDYSSAVGPSLKDLCHEHRGVSAELSSFPPIGPQQKRPNDFNAALKSKKFLITFLKFLSNEFQSEGCMGILKGTTLHFLFGPSFTYEVSVNPGL